MPEPDDLKNAILGRAETGQPWKPQVPVPEPAAASGQQANRVGKAALTYYVPRPVRDQLKLLAVQRSTTMQLLMAEALNDLFAKHELPEIAPLS